MLTHLLKSKLTSRKIRFLILMSIAAVSTECSHLSAPMTVDPFALPGGYISQQRIVLQGFSIVPTLHGDKAAVYFGYDRDKRYVLHSDNTVVAVDLIEFKLIESDGTWRWEPFVVISDDDFDGYADRIFVDADLDGVFEKIFDIRNEKLAIDKINYREISPSLQREVP